MVKVGHSIYQAQLPQAPMQIPKTILQQDLPRLAKKFGTPLYLYSWKTIADNYAAYTKGLEGLNTQICYAVKANSNVQILQRLAQLGAGFDVVSRGELARVIAAKGDLSKVVFAGVGKSHADIAYALQNNIGCFNIESESELYRIQTIAKNLQKSAPIAFRINTNIAVDSHPYLCTAEQDHKFGISESEILSLYKTAQQLSHIEIRGIATHLGSQICSLAPFEKSLETLLTWVKKLEQAGITLKHIDIGGGLGVAYTADTMALSISELTTCIQKYFQDSPYKIIIEPGRSLVANAGVILTSVEYLKHTPTKNYAILDMGMNDFMRPALYSAQHIFYNLSQSTLPVQSWTVVGPVCESGDSFFNHELALSAGDLLLMSGAGAYGFSMSSNYNTRCRPCELLIDNDRVFIIRPRETLAMLLAPECTQTEVKLEN